MLIFFSLFQSWRTTCVCKSGDGDVYSFSTHQPCGFMTLVCSDQTCPSVVAVMTVLQVVEGHSHNDMLDPRGANGVELRGWAAAQYSSHDSFALRAVQASPVWLVDHSSVELHPIIIKRCQSWSHILLPVSLITPPLLGFKQLLPAARTLHRSLGTDNGHINKKNITKSGITQISAKQQKYDFSLCHCFEETKGVSWKKLLNFLENLSYNPETRNVLRREVFHALCNFWLCSIQCPALCKDSLILYILVANWGAGGLVV